MKSSIAGLVGIAALAVIAAGHALGLGWCIAATVVLALVMGFGWPHYLAIPAKKTLGTVIALAGAVSALAAGLTSNSDYLTWTPLVTAVGFGAVMVVELVRGTGQAHRLESALGAAAGVALAAFAGGWVASYRFLGEPGMTIATAAGAAVALAIGMLRWPDRVNAPLAIVLGALAGPLAAMPFSDLRLLPAAVLGALVAAVIAAFRRLRTLKGPQGAVVGAVSAALAPVLSLGALVYFLDKMLLS